MKLAKLLPAILFSSYSTVAADKLPSLNLSVNKVSVSGISSGGYMANQFHIAYSDWVSGAGIISAGPYYCGQNDIKTALAQCVNNVEDEFTLMPLNKQLKEWAKKQKVADLDNLKNSRVWLLHGTQDQRVTEAVSDSLYQQYQDLIPAEQLIYIKDKPFGHHFPTLKTGIACDQSDSPFIGNCDFDAAGDMLKFLLGELNPRKVEPDGQVYEIDQQDLGGDMAASMADNGFLYVPQSCQQGQACQLHVSFHGCNQNADTVQQAYVTGTGLNNWADTNAMVVLYPQTKSSLFMPLNPQGCWDWWGYTDEHYATRNGQQIQAVAEMVKQLAKK